MTFKTILTTICVAATFAVAFGGSLADVPSVGRVATGAEPTEYVELWPGLAPGETEARPNGEEAPGFAFDITVPKLALFSPEKRTKDVAILLLPGGGFNNCYYSFEAYQNADYWLERGYFVAALIYRVPRPVGKPIYWKALQDSRRAVRYLRANAERFGVDPNKIGALGLSAGACLALLTATNSETEVYEPVDDLDRTPANLNFAIPVYPAFVLDDGADAENKNRGEGASILPDYRFDASTPPMLLLHGDADIFSSLGSVEVYKKLRKMGIPSELHIYTGAPHGFANWQNLPNAQSWRDRCAAWLEKMGF